MSFLLFFFFFVFLGVFRCFVVFVVSSNELVLLQLSSRTLQEVGRLHQKQAIGRYCALCLAKWCLLACFLVAPDSPGVLHVLFLALNL